MDKLNISARDKNTRQVLHISNLEDLLKNVDRYAEIYFTHPDGKPYAFKSIESKAASTDDLDSTISGEDFSVDFSNIKNAFVELCDDQREIIMHIYFMYKNGIKIKIYNNDGELCDEINPKIILHGPAGSGKTTIIHFIEKLITWEESKNGAETGAEQKIKVLKCAFTGKAAHNIEGFTLNHIFSIPFYNTRSLTKKRLTDKMTYFEKCIFFICDEVSMVGEKLMNSVNMRLTQIFKNDKLYGDRFVLLVGDLYQIDPVMQKPVYPKSNLWKCCEFYELTKIIRQRDEKFIKALNNFRDSRMTEDDITLLKSRQIENIDIVPNNAIHIFYLNKRVDQMNNEKISKTNKPEEIVNAIEDWEPSNLRVMVDIRYMITYNLDFSDGLVNGTTGVAKGFDYDENNVVNTIWMEFHSDTIGAKTRHKYFETNSKPGFEKWVPIQRSKVLVKYKDNPKVSKHIANMFPLKAAEAITVHKSQGQTYHDGVCVHITNDRHDKLRTDKTLQYVALTRVTRLEDLYICGNLDFSITSSKFDRTEEILNKMRVEKRLKLAFETFEDKRGSVIVFLNTGLTFKEHHEFITADKWYGNASILIFTETNTVSSDTIFIPNFKIAFSSDKSLESGGMICYKKMNVSLEVIYSTRDDAQMFYLSLFLFEKCLFIITGVKGNLPDKDFLEEIKRLINKYIKNATWICLFGDFSMNVPDFFTEFKLNVKVPFNSPSSTHETRHDVFFTRNFDLDKNQIGFYEYIPSSHKPLYVKIPPDFPQASLAENGFETLKI